VGSPDPLRSPFARALDALHLLGISLFLAIALAGVARGAGGAGTAAACYGALLAATALLASRARAGAAPGWLSALHMAWSLPALTATFACLRWLAPAATGLPCPIPDPVPPGGRRFDDALAALDLRWFGLDVARWSEGFLTAPVADVLMVFYFLYFAMPLAAFAAFALRGDRAAVYRPMFAVALGVYACYALYLLVPAAGPRHAYVGRSAPLPAGWIAGALHDFIRDGEPQPFDAFPSCHVVLGLLCAILSWPIGGWFRWLMAVLGAGTAVSTVVLRYHYLVDDLAGLVVVALALGAMKFLDARIAGPPPGGPHPDRAEELLR
jgi:membrane-associated phospholipid phosphatase